MKTSALRIRIWGSLLAFVLIMPAGLYVFMTDETDPLVRTSTLASIGAVSALVCSAVIGLTRKGLGAAVGSNLGLHRYLGLLIVALVTVHVTLTMVDDPSNFGLLVPGIGSAASLAATAALITLIALVGTTRIQKRRYTLWHNSHIILTMATLILVALHVYLLNHLIIDSVMRVAFIVLADITIASLIYRWLWLPFKKPRARGRHRYDPKEATTVVHLKASPHHTAHGSRSSRSATTRPSGSGHEEGRRRQPELHTDRPARTTNSSRIGNPLPADWRERGPLSRGEPPTVGVRRSDDPEPGYWSTVRISAPRD